MKTKLFATTVLAFAAMSSVSAFAMIQPYGESAQVIQPVVSTSTLSRAEVQADYLQARQNHMLPAHSEVSFVVVPTGAPTATRAEVRMQAATSTMKDGGSAF